MPPTKAGQLRLLQAPSFTRRVYLAYSYGVVDPACHHDSHCERLNIKYSIDA